LPGGEMQLDSLPTLVNAKTDLV